MQSILHDLSTIIRQASPVLANLSSQDFVRNDPCSYGSSIGAHLRHSIDHCQSFLKGVDEGSINYDDRERDEHLEADKDYALTTLDRTARLFSQFPQSDPNSSITVRVDGPTHHDLSHSTVLRELQFLLSHTVHHYASIALICRVQGHRVPTNFGVAPSTIEYRKTLQQGSNDLGS